jgi:NAD(P)H-dependent FMN reductase
MSEHSLNVLAVVGNLNRLSSTRSVVQQVAQDLAKLGARVDMLDLLEEPLPLFNPDHSHAAEGFGKLKDRVEGADVYVLGTPDYHGSISSTLKNFLDHFWHEFAGKLFAPIVASHEKGLTVTDQLRTVARQCYAWTMPYGMSFADQMDVKEGKIVSEAFRQRLQMFVHDIYRYGQLLAQQRSLDLKGAEPGFLARWRASSK